MAVNAVEVTVSSRLRGPAPIDAKDIVSDGTELSTLESSDESYEGLKTYQVDIQKKWIYKSGVFVTDEQITDASEVTYDNSGDNYITASFVEGAIKELDAQIKINEDAIVVATPKDGSGINVGANSVVNLGGALSAPTTITTDITNRLNFAANFVFHGDSGTVIVDNAWIPHKKYVDDEIALKLDGLTYIDVFDPANPPTPAPEDGQAEVDYVYGSFFNVNAGGHWNFTTGDQTDNGGADNEYDLVIGDRIIYNSPSSGTWSVIPATGAVISVNGQAGVVVLTTSDIAEGTNLYYTDLRVTNNSAVQANTAKFTPVSGNGITVTGASGIVNLGGALSGAVTITGNNHSMLMGQTGNRLNAFQVASASFLVDVTASTIIRSTSQVFVAGNPIGIEMGEGGVSGGSRTISAKGSEGNIRIDLEPKGVDPIRIIGATYETRVTDDNDVPNKKYVDDKGGVTGTVKGEVQLRNSTGDGRESSDHFYYDIVTETLLAGGSDALPSTKNGNGGSFSAIIGEEHVVNNTAVDVFVTGWKNVIGTGSGFTGSASFACGTDNLNTGINSFVGGLGGEVTADVGFVWAGNSRDGNGLPLYESVKATAEGAINISANYSAQTVGHGALAINCAILGGINHNIPSDSPRSVILGGNAVKARAALPDTGYVENLIIGEMGGEVMVVPRVAATVTTGEAGQFRYNSTDDSFEGYTSADGWGAIGGGLSFDVQPITHTGGDLNIDFSNGRIAVVTLQADVDNLAFTGVDYEGVLIFLQDSTGGWNILSWGGVKTVDGVTPDLSLDASAESFFNVTNLNGSTYMFGAGKLGAVA